ncbi:hypothetical protein BFS06_12185 [Clostridium perfringens]|uniref:TraC-like domain-containing protein n=1 Tax=Clostridium perfringens TaxID=1502 RepID=A0A140GR04_CLOPF|nr:hypothetical protein [Clostridium perfringens]AMN30963.1 hypothetical protein JFP838_pA0047 [Clostridium perfringens]TBX14959.1 hypothetical protein BFS06_12185 [Clostridium perfringens]
MLIAIIGVLVMLLFIGGMGFAMYYALRKFDPNKNDTSVNENAETAQEFLPFHNIQDSMIDLGNHQYRAIIECSSINYYLRTEQEQQMIELSFQTFLNSIKFPMTLYVQTRTVDNTAMLNNLKHDLQDSVNAFGNLKDYANYYYDSIANLHETIGNNKQKKKYIILTYNDAQSLEKLNDEEKYEYSLREMGQRCQIVMNNLSKLKIKTKILNTSELLELIYSTYNKDNYSDIGSILNGEYSELMVEGSNKLQTTPKDGIVDWILNEAINRLDLEVLQTSNDIDLKNEVDEIIKRLEETRDSNAGYFKSSKTRL